MGVDLDGHGGMDWGCIVYLNYVVRFFGTVFGHWTNILYYMALDES
jgi:hypothetical protein